MRVNCHPAVLRYSVALTYCGCIIEQTLCRIDSGRSVFDPVPEWEWCMVRRSIILGFILVVILLAACRDEEPLTPLPSADATLMPDGGQPGTDPGSAAAPTVAPPTVIPATPTPTEPMAAIVNGRPIFLAEYEKELSRYEQAQAQLGVTGDALPPDYRGQVLEALVETELIAQAAEGFGIVLAPEIVDARLAELQELSGGTEQFEIWLQTNQMTIEEFREALTAELITEQTVQIVTADVPTAVEQVHASYLQVDDPTVAQSLLDQVRSGADFGFLAQQNSLDRITGENGGDLGYFARGSLLVSEVEDAAFSLQPGQISEVISGARADGTGTTYYLVMVIERDPQRELTADMLHAGLQERFESWLVEQESQSQIIRFVETGA